MKRTELRHGLPEVPMRLRGRPLDHRGYPVPWFVAMVNGEWDFRIIDTPKIDIAVSERRCWVCGNILGKWQTFVTGPMCAVNRTTAEPPCHYDCAVFSVLSCPFLTLPKAKRNDANLPAGYVEPPGVFVQTNPGVTCLLSSTKPYTTWNPGNTNDHRFLIEMPLPERIELYANGRRATPDEITGAMQRAFVQLREAANIDQSHTELETYITAFLEVMRDQPQ
jgi:hypothetical protein